MPPLTEKLFAVTNHLQRKNKFSPMEFHEVHQPHLRAGLMPGAGGQHKKKSVDFVWFLYSFGHGFNLPGLGFVCFDFHFEEG